jgi:hypothetical protein
VNLKGADAAYYHIITAMNVMLTSIDEIFLFMQLLSGATFLGAIFCFSAFCFKSLYGFIPFFSVGELLVFATQVKYFILLNNFRATSDSDSYYVAVH